MGSANIIMALWIKWKKHIEPLIKLDSQDAKNAQDLNDGATGDIYYTRMEMPFNSLMTVF